MNELLYKINSYMEGHPSEKSGISPPIPLEPSVNWLWQWNLYNLGKFINSPIAVYLLLFKYNSIKFGKFLNVGIAPDNLLNCKSAFCMFGDACKFGVPNSKAFFFKVSSTNLVHEFKLGTLPGVPPLDS